MSAGRSIPLRRWLSTLTLLGLVCGRDATAPAAPHDTTVVVAWFFAPLAPRQTAAAYAVTDDSILSGVSYDPSTLFQRATRWVPGQPPQDMGGPGDPANGPSTNAGANRNGFVAGFEYNPGNRVVAREGLFAPTRLLEGFAGTARCNQCGLRNLSM